MKSIWQDETRRGLNDRVGGLAWDRRAEWGTFTAPRMVCHLVDSLRMAMGDLKVAPKRLPIRYPPLKQLIIYVAPISERDADRARAVGARAARLDERRRGRAVAPRARGRQPHHGRVARAPRVRQAVETRLGCAHLPAHGPSSEAVRRMTITAETARMVRQLTMSGSTSSP